jgi:DNA-binding NtrC family response regulator
MSGAGISRGGDRRILIVEDDLELAGLLQETLEQKGYVVEVAGDAVTAEEKVAKTRPGLLLLDLCLPPQNSPECGLELLRRCMGAYPATKVIVMTGHRERSVAARSLELGALDFVDKLSEADDLEVVIRRAFARRDRENACSLTSGPSGAPDQPGRFGMIGRSEAMQHVFAEVVRCARAETNLLITGMSGTGKFMVAKAVHEESRRSRKPLVVVNCGSLPETLAESELFGHEKGAFTGASTLKPGAFELANGGSLFLDEVGEVPPRLQVKFLHAVENKFIQRVGGTKKLDVDVRIIAATNRDLGAAVDQGRFREDLYYRLDVLRIRMPSLRERDGDLRLLAEHLVRKASIEYKTAPKRISDDALRALEAHSWPGNVRELENVLRRAVATAGVRGIIQLGDLDRNLRRAASAVLSDDKAEMIREAEVASTSYASSCANPATKGESSGKKFYFTKDVEESVKERMLAALREAGGNKARAARALGMRYTTFVNRIKRFRLGLFDGGS